MMEINATLLGQMITFAVFVWFTMKFIWPPIIKAMREREKKIADGLQAAERGQHELELAHHKAAEQLRDAKIQAAELLEQANKRASHIIEQAKERARDEGERLLVIARSDIEQEVHVARQQLRNEIAKLAVAGAEKILMRSVDAATQRELVARLITEI
jgi:F-type H+-transporting ATPase subunit b